MSQTQQPTDDPDTAMEDEWVVWDLTNDNQRTADSRSDAEDMIDTLEDLADEDETIDTETFPPGEGVPQVTAEAYQRDDFDTETDDTDAQPAEVVDEADPAPDTDHAPEALSPEEIERHAADLDDRDVGQDPLKWMPGEFVDTIDGSQAINRKGFEVLRFFYGIDLEMDMEIDPEDNDMTHCRFTCVATDRDGNEIEAWGTSHVDRGDDPWLLVEMAATRARKRAISIATGAGAVAVAELKNEPGE